MRATIYIRRPSEPQRLLHVSCSALHDYDPTEHIEQFLSEGNAEPAEVVTESSKQLDGHIDIITGVDDDEPVHTRWFFTVVAL